MQHFNHNIINLYGEQGKNWLNSLPELIQLYAEKWHLKQLTPFKNLTYNYVLSAFQNTLPVILKISPDHKTLKKETTALKAFKNHACVKLYAENKMRFLLNKQLQAHHLKTIFMNVK